MNNVYLWTVTTYHYYYVCVFISCKVLRASLWWWDKALYIYIHFIIIRLGLWPCYNGSFLNETFSKPRISPISPLSPPKKPTELLSALVRFQLKESVVTEPDCRGSLLPFKIIRTLEITNKVCGHTLVLLHLGRAQDTLIFIGGVMPTMYQKMGLC